MQGPTGLVTGCNPLEGDGTNRRQHALPLILFTLPNLHTKGEQLHFTNSHDSHLIQVNRLRHVRVGDTIIANDVHHLLYRVDAHLLHSTPHTASSPPRLVRPLRSPVVDILQPALQPRIHEGSLLSLGEPLRGHWVGLAVQ